MAAMLRIGAKAGVLSRIELAATVTPVVPSGPDMSASPSQKTDAGGSAGEARIKECKLQWKAADTNGDGVLDASEIARYNATIRTPKQAVLPDNARLTEEGFMAACSAAGSHE
jgi:hypothetical protein